MGFFDFLTGISRAQQIELENQKIAFLQRFREEAYGGNAEAQFQLGEIYFNGISVSYDQAKAKYWWEQAAAQDYPKAQKKLGDMYAWGSCNVEQDYIKAKQFYEKAAVQGYKDAQFCLGELYYYGKGIEQNYQQARKWYEKAARQKHAAAQYKLAVMYEYGEGGVKDIDKAKNLYEDALYNGYTK